MTTVPPAASGTRNSNTDRSKQIDAALEELRSLAHGVYPPLLADCGLPEALRAVAARSPMGRAGRPENIAAACVFLASDDADYITGHTLSVNGGRYSN